MQQVINTPGFSRLLESYHQVQGDAYIGLVTKSIDLDSIVNEGKTYVPRAGYRSQVDRKVFVKKLGPQEIFEFPPARFVNSLKLYHYRDGLYSEHFAEPMGIIYEGDLKSIALRGSNCYFLAQYIEGKPFSKSVRENNPLNKVVFGDVHRVLREYRENGIFLLDFAPRDILVTPNPFDSKYTHPVFLDTEDVEYAEHRRFGTESVRRTLTEKQREQFIEDYSNFYDTEDLKKILEIVFRGSTS